MLLRSRFRDWRRQLSRHHDILKSDLIMRTIAERLVLRCAAAAKGNLGPPREPENSALLVADLKITLNQNRSVALNR